MRFFGRTWLTASTVILLAASSFAGALPTPSKPNPAARKWAGSRIRLAISSSIFKNQANFKPGSDVSGAIDRAISHWATVADVEIIRVRTERQSVSPSGPKGDGVSVLTIASTPENIAIFGSDASAISAKTRVFTDGRGAIVEADVVLNPFAQFSTDGSFGTYDLETVLTHEIGHVLGLRHSAVMGSIMNANIDLNGDAIGGKVVRRDLTGDDIAAIRSIYDVAGSKEDCCGSVSGPARRESTKFLAWAQDEDGRIAATTSVAAGREFSISGLETGNYRVLLSDSRRAVADLGGVSVVAGDSVNVDARLNPALTTSSLKFIGSYGTLSESAVNITAGSISSITVGGKNLSANTVQFFTSSPLINVIDGSARDVDYADDIDAIRLQIVVGEDVKPGAYTLFGRLPNGSLIALPGAITIAQR